MPELSVIEQIRRGMKAEITRIGTIEDGFLDEGYINEWGFDCHGRDIKDFIREDTEEPCCMGWSLSELRDISEAAQRCPLHKLGVLFN